MLKKSKFLISNLKVKNKYYYMGVPQFFHWLVSRFEGQLLRETFPGGKAPEYLYLDFNCGIHPAAKADGLETLDDMFDAIIHYLEIIVKQVKPSKLIYIAIDGVAPMAKMRQQRIRRFKTIQERKEHDAIDRKHRRWLSAKFDFNMISPGTEFMEGLTAKLHAFLQTKGNWHGCQVILTAADEEREGEHKIMAHIRKNVPKKGQVVIYGLDSDLIFLSMLHYRPNMSLFREKLFFSRTPTEEEKNDPEKKFTFLDISQLRDIVVAMMNPALTRDDLVNWELLKPKQFDARKNNRSQNIHLNQHQTIEMDGNSDEKITLDQLRKEINLGVISQNRLVVDYVALSFFLGNDFLPYLPSLKIKEGGLNRIIECYKVVQCDLPGQYLVREDRFNFNYRFLCKLLLQLIQWEKPDLKEQQENSLKRRSKFKTSYRFRNADKYQKDVMDWEYIEDKWKDELRMGSSGWKSRYYWHYFGTDSRDMVNKVIVNFLEGLIWMLRYYQADCPSWSWSYQHLVAPSVGCILRYLEDQGEKGLEFNFVQDQPVRSAEQLLMILPPQSHALIPEKYAKLMKNPESPLIGQYPTNFQLDLQGHRYRHECYPMLPVASQELIKQCVEILD